VNQFDIVDAMKSIPVNEDVGFARCDGCE
jgi:hypothetical protein